MSSRRIAVLVSNDLNHDQRVRKTCETLVEAGWTPLLVGREMKGSKPYSGPWEAHRLTLGHHEGPWFYLELQKGLRSWLREHGPGLGAIWSNDLDTLWPAVSHGSLPVVYDSHEYFTEAAGLTGKPLKRAIWLALERWCMKRLPAMITVNEPIAAEFRRKYGLPVRVVRNMPRLQTVVQVEGRTAFEKHGVPTDLPIALMQGAYMDRDRGAAEAVAALPGMPGIRLVLVGAGTEWEEAAAQVDDPRFESRLHCIPKLPFEDLRELTASADVGLSLDKGGHGNYEMSLPNKLFDFMHAGLPMVVTARKQVAEVVQTYRLGEVIDTADVDSLKRAVDTVLSVPRDVWRSRAMAARDVHHWDVDAPKLLATLEDCLKAHLAGNQTA